MTKTFFVIMAIWVFTPVDGDYFADSNRWFMLDTLQSGWVAMDKYHPEALDSMALDDSLYYTWTLVYDTSFEVASYALARADSIEIVSYASATAPLRYATWIPLDSIRIDSIERP